MIEIFAGLVLVGFACIIVWIFGNELSTPIDYRVERWSPNVYGIKCVLRWPWGTRWIIETAGPGDPGVTFTTRSRDEAEGFAAIMREDLHDAGDRRDQAL
jgi:hypothetical protein